MKGKKEKSKRQKLVRELDRLWKIRIRERDVKCRICGSDKVLQAHHIFRKRMSVRFSLKNGILLCRGCHLRVHQEPEEFRRWILENLMTEREYDELYLESRQMRKFTLKDLERIFEELGGKGTSPL